MPLLSSNFEDTERGPDEDLRLQFETIARMSGEEKRIIRELIDGMILKYQARRWVQPAQIPAAKPKATKENKRGTRRRTMARAGA